ncbi:MAG: ComEA family DNA-binding protein [Candidatus Hydrothermia bacterium]
MQKLLLLYCTIFISFLRESTTKINPNEATFEELISIPYIDEDIALRIITQRDVKPFRNFPDFVERTGIDSTCASELERLLHFEKSVKTTLSFYSENSTAQTVSRATFNDYEISVRLFSKKVYSYDIIFKKLYIGNFGLNWGSDGFLPTLRSHDFSLLYKSSIQFSIGKNKMALGGKVNSHSYKIACGLIAEKDQKILTYLHTRLPLKGSAVDIDFNSSQKEIKCAVRASGYATRFKGQIRVKEKTPNFSCYFQRRISNDTYFTLSSYGNSHYVSISKLFEGDVNLFFRTKITPNTIKFHEIRIQGKILNIFYTFTDQERLGLSLANPLFSVGLTQYLRESDLRLKCSFDFHFHNQNATIDLELKRRYMKFAFKYYA